MPNLKPQSGRSSSISKPVRLEKEEVAAQKVIRDAVEEEEEESSSSGEEESSSSSGEEEDSSSEEEQANNPTAAAAAAGNVSQEDGDNGTTAVAAAGKGKGTTAVAAGKRTVAAASASKTVEVEEEEVKNHDDLVKKERIKGRFHNGKFTLEDETKILQSILENQNQGDKSCIDAVLTEMKNSIDSEITKSQLKDKIQKLRSVKYKQYDGKSKKGKHMSPEELKCYEMMQKIWKIDENEHEKRGKKRGRKGVVVVVVGGSGAGKVVEGRLSSYPFLNEWVQNQKNSLMLERRLSGKSEKKLIWLEQKLEDINAEEVELRAKRAKLDEEVYSEATSD